MPKAHNISKISFKVFYSSSVAFLSLGLTSSDNTVFCENVWYAVIVD